MDWTGKDDPVKERTFAKVQREPGTLFSLSKASALSERKGQVQKDHLHKEDI